MVANFFPLQQCQLDNKLCYEVVYTMCQNGWVDQVGLGVEMGSVHYVPKWDGLTHNTFVQDN